jgi:hypothetical protein
MEPQVQPLEAKVFYCTSPHYEACVDQGQQVMKDGHTARINENYLKFTPIGNQYNGIHFGMVSTADPQQIEFIEREIAKGNPDFMTPQMFKEAITPAEMKVQQLREQAAGMQRELVMSNKLIEDLRQKNPALYAQLSKNQVEQPA